MRLSILLVPLALVHFAFAELACEKTLAEITCPADSFIDITFAAYGRTSTPEPTCGRGPESLGSDSCDLGSAQSTVEAACESQPSCSFNVTNEFFGADPCPNVVKYLNYTFECIEEPGDTELSATACEGDTLVLRCPDDLVIEISSSNFGRTETTTETCGFGPASLTNTNCFDPEAPAIIAAACEGNSECELPVSVDDFSGVDPCPGTKKVAEVSYSCVESVDVSDAQQICEGETATLTCETEAITVTTATFGRRGTVPTCGKGPQSLTNTSCGNIDNQLDALSELCNGEITCEYEVDVDVIGFDPCPGTVKYLEYDFTCGEAPESPSATPMPGTPAPGTPGPETPGPETPGPETPAPSTPAPSQCGSTCIFMLAGDPDTVALTGDANVAFTPAIVAKDSSMMIGKVYATGQASVGRPRATTPITKYGPAALTQPYSSSFFKTAGLADGGSGVAHETPQGNQGDFLSNLCVSLPLTGYEIVDENGNVVGHGAGTRPFQECVAFTIA